MKLKWENVAISIVYLPVYYTAPLNGSLPITAGTTSSPTANPFPLPSVSSSEFTTVFEYARTLEDIGSLEVLDIFFQAVFKCACVPGGGNIRFQLSGDGGQTFVTIAEASANSLSPLPFTPVDSFSGAGSWIPFIESGDNKLVIRCQTRANSGTVNTILYDLDKVLFPYPPPFFVAFTFIDSRFDILYRKKVLF